MMKLMALVDVVIVHRGQDPLFNHPTPETIHPFDTLSIRA